MGRKSLVKNSIYNIFYKIVSVLYPLVAVTYVSHILEAQRMGMVSYAQNIVSYFVVFAALGIPTYGIRETAKRLNDRQEYSNLFFELILINTASTTIALAAYGALILKVDLFRKNLYLYVIAGLQIALNYANVDWFYQGLEEYKYISIRSIIVKLCSLIALPLLIHSKDDYINYALIFCLAIAGNNIFNILHIRKYIVKPSVKIHISKHLKPIFTLLIVSIAVEIYSMIDTTMLGVICGDTAVGCYSNAMKLTRMVNTTTAAIGAVLFPRLSFVYEKGKMQEFNDLVNKGIKVMLVFAIPASVGLIVLGEEIVRVLFGYTFMEAVPTLRVLALMVPVVVCNTIMGGQVLVTSNMERRYVLTVCIASCVNIVLNLMLIPKYGMRGAALASLVSECLDLILYAYFSHEIVRLTFTQSDCISTIIPIGLYIIIARNIIENIPNDIVKIMLNIIVCFIIYFGVGLLLKNSAMIFMANKVNDMRKRSL